MIFREPLRKSDNARGRQEFVRRDAVGSEVLVRKSPAERVRNHLWRIERDLIDDPAGAVSSAKDLIESVCLGILSDRGKSVGKAQG